MKLGFIGIGNVGGTLARKLGARGHSINLTARDLKSDDIKNLKQAIGGHANILNLSDCISESDIVFLAVPWSAVTSLLQEQESILENKVLVDCTNPLKRDLSGLELSGENSGGEHIQKLLPKTKVVKAFNTVGFNIMESPMIGSHKACMYFAGNDAKARHQIRELIEDVGLEPVDAGELRSSRLLEPLALLWISSAYKFGLGRDFAFGILKK